MATKKETKNKGYPITGTDKTKKKAKTSSAKPAAKTTEQAPA